MGQMGNLFIQKKEYENALKLFIQAFLVFTKLGSPYANPARKDIGKNPKKAISESKQEDSEGM